MAPTPALWFLSFVLFFFMNGHGIDARDLKVELRDEKQVDSYGEATPVSKDEPYLTGYKTTQPNYVASYTFMKHIHASHHGKHNEPYLTGYGTSTHEVNDPYLTGYKTSGAHEASQPVNYITAYGTSTHDSNEPCKKTGAQEANQPYSHIAGYKPTADDLTQYAFAAKKDPKESAHDSTTEPYITHYGNGPKKDSKESARDSGEPYLTQYGGSGPIKGPKESASAQDSTKPYVTHYGLPPKKESAAQDSVEPYTTQHGNIGPRNYPKESARYHNKPYVTQYGGHDPKQDSKESTQDYSATYKKKSVNAYAAKKGSTHFTINRKSGQDLEESKVWPYSNVDHTEAFKTGFFSLDDLYVGNKMTLQFPVQEFSHFLPKREADSIPFSMSQLPGVLQLYSISEDSPQAKSMRDTLEQCEAETITGETKVCANSLESMLEFVGSIIGSETKYDILTTSHPTTSSGVPLQKYTILEVSQDIYAPKWVACHPLPYPYAIYYCHFIATGSKVFKVILGGENGNKIEALGICHLDTSDWSPNHIVFKQLGIKPGKAPVCHFFPVKHLMWVPQTSKATM